MYAALFRALRHVTALGPQPAADTTGCGFEYDPDKEFDAASRNFLQAPEMVTKASFEITILAKSAVNEIFQARTSSRPSDRRPEEILR
jgi:hypothetical protein